MSPQNNRLPPTAFTSSVTALQPLTNCPDGPPPLAAKPCLDGTHTQPFMPPPPPPPQSSLPQESHKNVLKVQHPFTFRHSTPVAIPSPEEQALAGQSRGGRASRGAALAQVLHSNGARGGFQGVADRGGYVVHRLRAAPPPPPPSPARPSSPHPLCLVGRRPSLASSANHSSPAAPFPCGLGRSLLDITTWGGTTTRKSTSPAAANFAVGVPIHNGHSIWLYDTWVPARPPSNSPAHLLGPGTQTGLCASRSL